MNLGKQIKKHREAKRLSQEELAEKIYVSRQTISNWENEKSYPDIHNILMLSVLFNVSLDELVKGDIDTMKKEIAKTSFNRWAYVMLISLILAPLTIAPAVRFIGRIGLIIPVIFAIIGITSSIILERAKKKNNIKTYSEILAYMENKEPNESKVSHEKSKWPKTRIVMMVVCAIITLALIAISTFIFTIL